jgi:uncharacterized protein YndB with AHSA1/START domain
MATKAGATEERRPSAGADRALRLTRSFHAPREAVFRAFTERERFVQWWGPRGYTVPQCEMDVRPGGAWRTVMRSSEGTVHVVGGTYREVRAPERLVFTWAWETDGRRGDQTLVTLEFRDRAGATEIVLTHEPFESADARDRHGEGWSSSLDCLAEHLATR